MNNRVKSLIGCAVLLWSAGATSTYAQRGQRIEARNSVTLSATGTFANGGAFSGTATINRFERRGNGIVAVGVVQGVLRRGDQAIGTALAAPVTWQVTVKTGGISAASGHGQGTGQLQRAAFAPPDRFVRVQAQACPVLQVALAPNEVNLLGARVSLDPIALEVAGDQGTPLGDLICEASELIGNVAGIVNLVNNLLALLTGLLGGLTGGLVPGGLAPGPPVIQ
jgi:hypothetical protein